MVDIVDNILMMPGGIFIWLFGLMGITLFAQGYLKMTYNKYTNKRAGSGLTGAEVARRLLDQHGLHHVRIERIGGKLHDHYDPRGKVVRLSPSIHDAPSQAAVAVAAHEVGHAIQHAEGYAFLKFRTALVPLANLGSRLGPWMIILGLIMGTVGLPELGLLLMSFAALFQVVTLPVEFDASARAMRLLTEHNIVYDAVEASGSRKVLTAAALTYVAALLVTILELLRFMAMINSRR